jgi:hypothetical protein
LDENASGLQRQARTGGQVGWAVEAMRVVARAMVVARAAVVKT